MSDEALVAARISSVLRKSLLIDVRSGDTDILELGLIDSAGLMDLFAVLEKEFGIRIETEELQFDHFRTVHRMASFVMRKRRANEGSSSGERP